MILPSCLIEKKRFSRRNQLPHLLPKFFQLERLVENRNTVNRATGSRGRRHLSNSRPLRIAVLSPIIGLRLHRDACGSRSHAKRHVCNQKKAVDP
jgi:hypothetical protein